MSCGEHTALLSFTRAVMVQPVMVVASGERKKPQPVTDLLSVQSPMISRYRSYMLAGFLTCTSAISAHTRSTTWATPAATCGESGAPVANDAPSIV
jgi:hypothetical protein